MPVFIHLVDAKTPLQMFKFSTLRHIARKRESFDAMSDEGLPACAYRNHDRP